jgi:hypothetical protein
MLRNDVAALYVDPRGPYPTLVEHWYDEAKDARTYAGPWPVVAHPPCGPWGRLYKFCTRQPSWCGPHSVNIVRKYGGCLEHPESSKLWAYCGLPRPNAPPDLFGGYTLQVDQVNWGHAARKRSWIYLVGVTKVISLPTGGTPTCVVRTTRKDPGRLPEMRKSQRHITPQSFAEWLLQIASTARV